MKQAAVEVAPGIMSWILQDRGVLAFPPDQKVFEGRPYGPSSVSHGQMTAGIYGGYLTLPENGAVLDVHPDRGNENLVVLFEAETLPCDGCVFRLSVEKDEDDTCWLFCYDITPTIPDDERRSRTALYCWGPRQE